VTRTALSTGKDGSLSAMWRFASIVVIFLLVWPPIFGIVPTESYLIFLIASLIASVICWRVTRRFARVA
jgi:hypothetical protein